MTTRQRKTKSPRNQTQTRTRLDPSAHIKVLPAGKKNPRREGTGPYKRYQSVLKARTVGAFLKAQPGWGTTLTRAVREKLIRVG